MAQGSLTTTTRTSSVVVLATVALACASPAKREAEALTAAVDQYRRAENEAKPRRAETVIAVACTDAEVCAVKGACMAAISPTVRALTLKDDVAARLADIEAKRLAPDSPEAAALPGKLDEAERLLKDGHAKMEACEKGLADLRVHHGS
jgi:hypothetical protein